MRWGSKSLGTQRLSRACRESKQASNVHAYMCNGPSRKTSFGAPLNQINGRLTAAMPCERASDVLPARGLVLDQPFEGEFNRWAIRDAFRPGPALRRGWRALF